MTNLRRIFRLLRTLARELSDEGAYERHLANARLPHSGEEWRAFIDRRHREKYQNAKCC